MGVVGNFSVRESSTLTMLHIVLIVLALRVQSALLDTVNEQKNKNVLFIAVDDLRPNIGPYRNVEMGFKMPKIKTPNLDRFSESSMVFERAYSQQAVCSPSRTSMLTSRRPDTTHVINLDAYFRSVGANVTTMPQLFKQNGYRSINIGKIFHPLRPLSIRDDPPSWDEIIHPQGGWPGPDHHVSWRAVTPEMEASQQMTDTLQTFEAIKKLEEFVDQEKTGGQPFFLGLGFHRPHLPFYVPQEFLDLYPESEIDLPDNAFAAANMPEIGWSAFGELRSYGDTSNEALDDPSLGQFNTSLPDFKTKELRRAYYGSVSYVDAQIGKVLDALQELGLEENTIVVVWGDHGWQLGEHNEWCKHTNFEIAARVPLLIKVPGLTDGGSRTSQLVESVDIFPTLVEAAGINSLSLCPTEGSDSVQLCTEGSSLMPLITQRQKGTTWKSSVFWQYPKGGSWSENVRKCMGYSVLSDMEGSSYHYTMWVQVIGVGEHGWRPDFGSWCEPKNAPQGELYDLTRDPQENINRYGEPDYAHIQKTMEKLLLKGWSEALPK